MTKVKRLVAVVLALMMILGSVSVASFADGSAWDATVSDGFALDVTTQIYRLVDGKWTATDKVKAGETVKARVFLDTDYFTSGGQLVFFYNTEFFSDSYTKDKQTLAVNPAVYAGGNYGITGHFYGAKSNVNIEGRLISQGVIDQAFADAHNFMAASFELAADKKNNIFIGEEWFCEFDLTVKADAPVNGEGDFFILAESFRDGTNKTRYSNISKGPSFGYNENVVDMSNWDATVTVDSTPVTLYKNYVEATFNAMEGAFADGRTTIVISGEAGEAINVGAPVREEYNFTGWAVEGSSDVVDVATLPAVDTVYVAQWESSTDNYDDTLKFKTDIYRQNENGEWVYTEKVIPGETVKARIYIDTTYATNAGDFLVFYCNDFFENADPNFSPDAFTALDVNETEGSAAAAKASGTYTYVPSTSRFIKRMVEAGLITQDFVNEHTAYTATYRFDPAVSQKLSGDYYFAEWTLKVKDTATGEGDFFVVENTIYNTSETGKKAYINIPVGEEGGSDNDAVSLYEINVSTDVESHPVTTVSSINFDANGGTFANGEATFVIEGDIADPVDAATVPEVTFAGNTFKGWVPADIAEPTAADVVEIPSEIPFDELYLKALWINEVKITLDPSNGEPVIEKVVTAGDEFEKPEVTVEEGKYLAGWVDGEGKFYEELPDVYPDKDTTYTALFDTYTYNVEYFVLNNETLNYERVSVVSTAYGDVIGAVPPKYTAPDGYSLSAAYKDTTFAADAALAAGETMPANNVKLYYKLFANKYPAVFKLDGGNINGNTDDVVIETVYGQQIKAPANPVKEGYTFTGWSPMLGMMDSAPQEFVATWEATTYYVTYIVEGEEYEVYDVPFGLEVEMPLDPVLPGYNFVGWDNEIPETMPAGDLTFTAVFEEKLITVTLKLDGGNYNGSTDDIVIEGLYGDDLVAPGADELKKQGYVFGGWEPALPDTLPTEDTAYTAIWNPAKDTAYTVEIYYQDTEGNYASAPDEILPMTGETGALVNAAIATPYGFEISTTEGDYGKDVTIAADGSTVYKVYFDRVKYTIVFDGNGGTIDGEPTVSGEYRYLSTVVAPADAVLYKKGHTFAGWVPSVDSNATKDVTYVAQWTVNKSKLTITVDGKDTVIEGLPGSEVPADQIPETDKPGYTFKGWEDESGNLVDLPTTMPENDMSYEAKYDVNVHNVTFIVDGNVYNGPNATNYGDPIAVPSVPTKNGYVFAAWKDADGKQPSDYAGMPDKALEFTAEWTANANIGYVLEVYEMNTDGTYPSAPTSTYEFNDGVVGDDRTVTPTVPTGFVLDVESIETPEKSELTGKIPATGTLVLKAYFAREKHTLYINVEGTITEEVYNYGQKIDDIADPVKEGHTFKGWNPEVPANMPNEDVTVEAQFEKNTYTATFDANGGIFDDGESVFTDDILFGEDVETPADKPEMEGYKFLGWSTDGETVIDNLGKMPEGGQTYIAVWEKSAITVTFYNFLPSEKGPAVPEGQKTYVYDQKADYRFGDAIVFPADPVIQGHEENYVFTGWVDADGKAVEAGATAPAADLNIYATYERVKVMLIPKNDSCTTVIDRNGLTVDDYTEDSTWYVYGLEELLPLRILLSDYIDVQGDGTIVVTKIKDNSSYYGTGSIIDVYDNVTGEIVESFRIIIFGDLDGDSVANGVDLSIMSEEVLGTTGWSIDGLDEYVHYLFKAANLRMDDVVNGLDRTLLNEHVLGVGFINQETAVIEY